METAPVREVTPGASAAQSDTRLLETSQRQLDTLRATMDARLAELEVALSDPSRSTSLPALVLELSRLATSEAHATAARICMQLRHDGDAALLDLETRHASVLEAQRKAAWDQQWALENAQKRIELLESEKQSATQAAQDHGQMLEVERAARTERERAVALLERQLQVAATQLDEVTTAARKRAEEHAQVFDEASSLRADIEDLSGRFAVDHAQVAVLSRQQATANDRIAALQRELEQALQRVEIERHATARAVDERDQAIVRIATMDTAIADVQRQREEASQRLAPEAKVRGAQARQLAEAVSTLKDTRQHLDVERATAAQLRAALATAQSAREAERESTATLQSTTTELRTELAAVQSARDADRQAISTLEHAAADVNAMRGAHADALRERDAERLRVAELERAQAALHTQLESHTSALADLTRRGDASDDARAALVDDLNRVTTANAALESALAQEQERARHTLTEEHERRQTVEQSQAEVEALRRDLAEALRTLEAAERARSDAQHTVDGFDTKVARIEDERQMLAAALDAERTRATDLHQAVAAAEHRLAEAHAVAETLRLELLEAPDPVPTLLADEVELSFDEHDNDESARPDDQTGVRIATRYSFASRIEIGVNGKAAQLVNLSVAGCGIRTSSALDVGAAVIVQLPGEAGAPCEGIVVWSRRDGSKHTKAAYRSGVRFTKADVMAIEAFMILEADV